MNAQLMIFRHMYHFRGHLILGIRKYERRKKCSRVSVHIVNIMPSHFKFRLRPSKKLMKIHYLLININTDVKLIFYHMFRFNGPTNNFSTYLGSEKNGTRIKCFVSTLLILVDEPCNISPHVIKSHSIVETQTMKSSKTIELKVRICSIVSNTSTLYFMC